MKGLVLKSTGSWYSIKAEKGQIFLCKIKGNLRLHEIKGTNPIAIGDWVAYTPEGDDKGIITDIYNRKNYIIRKSSNLSRQYHIMAANIDQAILMITLKMPETPTEFIDRFLATAEAYSIPVKLVFNKIDMYEKKEIDFLKELTSVYEKISYPCYKISVRDGIGIEDMKKLLINRVTFISGNSGVGKTSLINLIEPSLKLKVAKISDYHLKGKHTTTFYEMFELSMGGYVIDSPGIKGFGVVDMKKEEIFHFFPEIFNTARNCQFHNCLHLTEPGCAVRVAIEQGTISELRYHSYLSLVTEDDSKYR